MIYFVCNKLINKEYEMGPEVTGPMLKGPQLRGPIMPGAGKESGPVLPANGPTLDFKEFGPVIGDV